MKICEKNTAKKILNNTYQLFLKCRFVIEFLVSILLGISVLKIFYYHTYFAHTSYKNIIFSICLIAIILFIIIDILRKKEKLEKVFLGFMIPIGMLFLIMNIPGHVPDEAAHIYRAYDVSKGILIAPVDENGYYESVVPKDMNLNDREQFRTYKMLFDKLAETNDYNDTEGLFNPAQSYSFVMYIFSAIAFLIGRLCGLNIFLVIYLARIFNFIFFLVAGYFTIKILPFGKWVAFTYLFNPILIHEATSISADSIVNSVILFFISYVIYLAYKKEKMNIKEKALLLTTGIIISLAKYVYFPIIFIAMILLNTKAVENKKDKRYIYITMGVTFILAIISYLLSTKYKYINAYVLEHNIDSTEQIKFILQHPLKYISIIYQTVALNGQDYFLGFNGKYLGWLNILVSGVPIILYSMMLLISPWLEKTKIGLKKSAKIWFSIIFIAVFVLVLTGMYLINSEIGADIILGVQGRYFLPIGILLLYALISSERYVKFKNVRLIYLTLLIFVDFSALNALKTFFLI